MAVVLDAPQRRVLFGFNVALQIALALLAVAAVLWAGSRFSYRADLTRTGQNSLSSRTVQHLRGLDQNIRITAIFAEPDRRNEEALKQRRQIKDLLDLYDAAGGARVTTRVLDPSTQKQETRNLLADLRALPAYADEARPHRELLERFAEFNRRFQDLTTGDVESLTQLGQADTKLAEQNNFNILRYTFETLAQTAAELAEQLVDWSAADLPQYGRAAVAVRERLTEIVASLEPALNYLQREGQVLAAGNATAEAYFLSVGSHYTPLLGEAREMLQQSQGLRPVALESLYAELQRWPSAPPILVESAREAFVIPHYEVWPFDQRGLQAGGGGRVFAGEAALSSAVLRLTQKERTAVVFTRFGGPPLLEPDMNQFNPMMPQSLPRAPFQELNQTLTQANFLTAEWNVATEKQAPDIAEAARTIYVVFPPTPSDPNPLQPGAPQTMTPADVTLVLDAVAESGRALFVTGYIQSLSPLPFATAVYEYEDYLRTSWGIEPLYTNCVVGFDPHPERPGRWLPRRRGLQLTSPRDLTLGTHPIMAPLAGETFAVALAAPLRLLPAESRPANLRIEPLLSVPDTESIWAVTDLNRLQELLASPGRLEQGLERGTDLIPPPFPLAVAAEGPQDQRLVVLSAQRVFDDQFANQAALRQVGALLVQVPLFSGNVDFLLNSLHWLAGEADRIAVGPRSANVPRLQRLDEYTATRVLPWILVVVWPATALLAGVGAWLVRRR